MNKILHHSLTIEENFSLFYLNAFLKFIFFFFKTRAIVQFHLRNQFLMKYITSFNFSPCISFIITATLKYSFYF